MILHDLINAMIKESSKAARCNIQSCRERHLPVKTNVTGGQKVLEKSAEILEKKKRLMHLTVLL